MQYQQCPQMPPLGKTLVNRSLHGPMKCSCGVGSIRSCANAHITNDFKPYVCAVCESRFRTVQLNDTRFDKIEELLRSHTSKFLALETELAENVRAQTRAIEGIENVVVMLKTSIDLVNDQTGSNRCRIDQVDGILCMFKNLFDRYHAVMLKVEDSAHRMMHPPPIEPVPT